MNRRTIIRTALADAIKARAHWSAIIDAEKSLVRHDEDWLRAARAHLERAVRKQQKALRLSIRVDYSPKQRRERDIDCALARCDEVALGGRDRAAWDGAP